MKAILQILLTKTVLAAMVRHLMTATGGILISQGLADQGTVQELTGGAVAAAGLIWSVMQKYGVV